MTVPERIQRWPMRLVHTLAIAILFEFLRCALTSPTERFQPLPTLVSLVPIVWGVYAWFTSKNLGECIVGWLALVFALWFVLVGIVGI